MSLFRKKDLAAMLAQSEDSEIKSSSPLKLVQTP